MCLAGGGGIATCGRSLSRCFAGWGGIVDGGGSLSICPCRGEVATGGRCVFRSLDGFKLTGRISGRFNLSAGMEDPSKPKWGRSAVYSSSSGLTQAFPFRNLSSLAVKREQLKSVN